MDYRRYQEDRYFRHLLSVPFIWAPLIVFIVLDIFVTIYHHICFPLYGLKKVKRSAYIQVRDRARLSYLSGLEKINCMYCGYVNGLLLYAKEIAGRTEKYWCGIMHQQKTGFQAHPDQVQRKFIAFGDKAALKGLSGREKPQSAGSNKNRRRSTKV